MHLEDKIAQITNPQEFTRLCNTVLTAHYDQDFQVIDGTRGDEGNDGYVVSEMRVIAMHCPIKPEKKTDKDYLIKIRDDLAKADALRRSGQYEVINWTFITPRKLSNSVISQMRAEADSLNIHATHQESTYIATLLYKHKHLIQAFPDLHIPDVDAKLERIVELLKASPQQQVDHAVNMDKDFVYKPDTKDNEEFDQLVIIRKGKITKDTRPCLRSIYYKTTDTVIKLNALLGLLDFYDPVEDKPEGMIDICDQGIQIAEQVSNPSAQAYFLAQKGYFISHIYSDLDMRTAYSIMAGNAIGFHTISEEQRQHIIKKLGILEEDYKNAFNEALELLKDNKDFWMLASILIIIGNAAGQRSLYLRPLGLADRAESEMRNCKRALQSAKDIYALLGDELSVANALFNLANQTRFFGEEKEALELTNSAIKTSEKYEDVRLLQRAKWLKYSLETGEIPDYVHGEKRPVDD